MFSSIQFQTLCSVPCFLIIALAANALASGKANGEKQTPATAINQVLSGVWRVGGSTWGTKDFPTVSIHGKSQKIELACLGIKNNIGN